MSFNYDFHPYLMRPRRLREASSEDSSFLSTTLSSLSSRGSTVSCMSGPMSDFFRDHAKEERYVQPGLRDIRIMEKYLLEELEVPEEIVYTWFPGYVPPKKEEQPTPTKRASYYTSRCILHNVPTPK